MQEPESPETPDTQAPIAPSTAAPKPKKPEENPLFNLLFNVLVPVLVLSYLSKDPVLQAKLGKPVHPWQLGPIKAVGLALALPIGYAIYHFYRTRKANFMSGLGLVSVLLSGGLTIYLWNADGTVKPNAGLLFGIKEGLIPLAIAVAVIASRWVGEPMICTLLYNDGHFDVPKIESKVAEKNSTAAYRALLTRENLLLAGSFVMSAILNVVMARWFFRNFDASAPDALEKYNGILGSIHWVGFLVVGVPLVGIFFLIMNRLLKGLQDLTGLEEKDLMLPR